MMTEIKLAGKTIKLDPDLLKFDEHTINDFLQKSASNYNTYAMAHADCQYILQCYESKYEKIYSEKFRNYREESSSDKLSEVKVKCDPEVLEALESVRMAKRNVNMLWGYLKSLDKASEACQNVAHNLRREMSKLFNG